MASGKSLCCNLSPNRANATFDGRHQYSKAYLPLRDRLMQILKQHIVPNAATVPSDSSFDRKNTSTSLWLP